MAREEKEAYECYEDKKMLLGYTESLHMFCSVIEQGLMKEE